MALQLMDTFATFVDSLAETLDDHDAGGEDIAARAYLSRFHFDRVVTGTAGETPATVAPAGAARAGRVSPRHERRDRARDRARGGLRLERGVHPRISPCVRRRTRRLADRSRPDPAREPERRPLPPTGRPPAAPERRGELHGPDDEDGGAPCVARRRDRRTRCGPSRGEARRADRGVGRGRRRRSHAALAPLAARRPDGHVERGAREPRRTTSASSGTRASRRSAHVWVQPARRSWGMPGR